MPALPPAASTVRIKLKHSQIGDLDVLDRFYMTYSGTAPTATLLATFATAVSTQWDSHLQSLASTDVALTEVVVDDLGTLSGASGIWTGTGTGTRSGTTNGAQVAVLLNFHVARRYRGGKPRVYLPYGTNSDLVNPQQWGSTFLTAMGSGWSGFITGIIGAVWTGGGTLAQANVSYYQGFASYQNPVTKRWHNLSTPRTTPLVEAITSVSVNPLLGSQRRRVSA